MGIDLIFLFSVLKIHTLSQTTLFQINTPSSKNLPLILRYFEFEIKTKNKKKKAKVSSRFTKKQVQASGFW